MSGFRAPSILFRLVGGHPPVHVVALVDTNTPVKSILVNYKLIGRRVTTSEDADWSGQPIPG